MTSRSARAATPHASSRQDRFALDARYYLEQSPRQLPSRYLYDTLGSALFEAICWLPWYTLTRAELRLLAACGGEILDATEPASIVELGPGSGDKLATLLAGRKSGRTSIDLHLVDISASALARARATLAAVDDLPIITHEMTYEAGLAEVSARRSGSGRSLALFLGSNIGNFDPPGREAFVHNLRTALRSGDMLLLGADLVKPERDMLLAYDDPLGVTAAFNRNLLVRINRELGGKVDIDAFAHRALWNDADSRIEMHLVSLRSQPISVPAADLDFVMNEGESIWTESSYKFRPSDLTVLLDGSGFRVRQQWVDEADPFALTLAERI